MELSDYRQQIDGIDSQLLALFYQRMEVAAQIAGYKKAHNLPALDAGRERAKLQQIADAAPEDLREYAVSLYSLIFELSRSCQNRLLGVTSPLTAEIEQAIARTPQLFPEHPAVACQGVEGAYSQLACDRLFTMPNVFYCATFEAVFAAIEKGLCRYGVIPLENSTAGSVNAVYDLMMQHNFRIVRSVRLKIDHCLLAKPGTKLSDIKEIYSHEQAISQCGRFLQSLPGVTVVRCENTAVAAKRVAESDRHGRRGALVARVRWTLRAREPGLLRAGSGQQLHALYLHRQGSRDLSRRRPHEPHDGAAAQAGLSVQGALALLCARHQPQQAREPSAAGARL